MCNQRKTVRDHVDDGIPLLTKKAFLFPFKMDFLLIMFYYISVLYLFFPQNDEGVAANSIFLYLINAALFKLCTSVETNEKLAFKQIGINENKTP